MIGLFNAAWPFIGPPLVVILGVLLYREFRAFWKSR